MEGPLSAPRGDTASVTRVAGAAAVQYPQGLLPLLGCAGRGLSSRRPPWVQNLPHPRRCSELSNDRAEGHRPSSSSESCAAARG